MPARSPVAERIAEPQRGDADEEALEKDRMQGAGYGCASSLH
ncbi:hypothetical protein LJR016_005314 [Devosia sp. LjRoot16]